MYTRTATVTLALLVSGIALFSTDSIAANLESAFARRPHGIHPDDPNRKAESISARETRWRRHLTLSESRPLPQSTSTPARMFSAPPSQATPATSSPDDIFWSPAFVNTEFDGGIRELVVYAGQLVAAGDFTTVNGIAVNGIAAWNGMSWSALGAGVNGSVHALVVYNGQLIAGGNFTTAGGVPVAKIASWDGSQWSALGIRAPRAINALQVYGELLAACGDFYVSTWDGSLWNDLGTGFDNVVASLCTYNGKLIAGGSFTEVSGVSQSRIAQWDGVSWSGFGVGVADIGTSFSTVSSMTVYNGSLIAGGHFRYAGGLPALRVASWNGTTWSSMGGGLNADWVYDLIVLNSVLYACGDIRSSSSGGVLWGIAQWTGTGWSSVGSGEVLNGNVNEFAAFDGGLVVGGSFTQIGSMQAEHIAFWHSSTWSPFGNGIAGSVNAFTEWHDQLILAGDFVAAGGAVKGIAAWSEVGWSPLGTGITSMGDPGQVTVLTVWRDNLIAAGYFDVAGNLEANSIAAWNGLAWSPLGSGITHGGGAGEAPGEVWSMAVWEGLLIVGGVFFEAGGNSINGIAAWDGMSWRPLRDNSDNNKNPYSVHAITTWNQDLIVSGLWVMDNGETEVGIASWDGESWTRFGEVTQGGGSGFVIALASWDEKLIVGGTFDAIGDVSATAVASWDGVQWLPLNSGVSTNGSPEGPIALAVWNGLLVVGGYFDFAGGIAANGIAAWDGSSWTSLGSGVDDNGYAGTVYALMKYKCALYVGGYFNSAGEKTSTGVAAWSKPSSTVSWKRIAPANEDRVRIEQGGTATRYIAFHYFPDESPTREAVLHLMGEDIQSDENGILPIEISASAFGDVPGLYTWDDVVSASVCGVAVSIPTPIRFEVAVLPRQYSRTWDVLGELTGAGGIGAGVQLGPVGVSAAQMSVRGTRGLGLTLQLKKQNGFPDRLVLGRRIEKSIGAELSVGKVDIELIQSSGAAMEATRISEEYQQYVFHDFYDDPDQRKAITAIFLEPLTKAPPPALSGATWTLVRALAENITSNGPRAQLIEDAREVSGGLDGMEGNFHIGLRTQFLNSGIGRRLDFAFPSAGTSLYKHGSLEEYHHSRYGDMHPGSNFGTKTKIALEFDVRNIRSTVEAWAAILRDGDIKKLMAILPSTEHRYGGYVEQGTEIGDGGSLQRGFITLASDDQELSLISSLHTFDKTTLRIDASSASLLNGVQTNLGNLIFSSVPTVSSGNLTTIEDYAATVTHLASAANVVSTKWVDYEKSVEESRVTDVKLEIPLQLGIVHVSVGGAITITESREFMRSRGVLHQGVYELERYSDDGFVQSDNRSLLGVLADLVIAAADDLGTDLLEALATYQEWLTGAGRTVVRNGKNTAQLVADNASWAANQFMQLTEYVSNLPFKNESGATVFNPYTARTSVPSYVDKGALADTNWLVVTAVGAHYNVDIIDSAGEPVDSFAAPLLLRLTVADTDLVNAGFGVADRNLLGVYHWDSDSACAQPVVSGLVGDTLEAQIFERGEYYAGINGYPPDNVPPTIDAISHSPVDTLLLGEPVSVWFSDTSQNATGLDLSAAFCVIQGDTLSLGLEASDLYHAKLTAIPLPDSQWSVGQDSVSIFVKDLAGHTTSLQLSFQTRCLCECATDPICDSTKSDVFDVVRIIEIAFRSGPPTGDLNCQFLSADVDCSGVVDIFDVVKVVNVAFRSGNAATEYCNPCP